MKKFDYTQAAADLHLNLIIGFVSLFILCFILINPVAKTGKIDPVTQIMVTMRWDDNSRTDIDLWVKAPTKTVGYTNKDGSYLILERDDLGITTDRYIIDGKEHTVKRNIETITINDIVPGEYVINIHFYGPSVSKDIEKVHVELLDLHPFSIVFAADTKVSYNEETTIVTFVVNDLGNIVDMRTDLQMSIKNQLHAP